MSTSSDIGVGVLHELAITGCKAGWESADFGNLAKSKEKLSRILRFVRGFEELGKSEHIIDCDDDPFMPQQQELVSHRNSGLFKWDPTKILLLRPKRTDFKRGETRLIVGQVREEFLSKPVCNGNVQDYLLKNPFLIPEDWKDRRVFFIGTVYQFGMFVSVRYMDWHGVNWQWDMLSDCNSFDENCVVAVFE